MSKFFLHLALLLAALPAAAQWKVAKHKDAMTDRVLTQAEVRSPDGATLGIWPASAGEEVALMFTPPAGDLIHHRRGIMVRVDKRPPHDFDDAAGVSRVEPGLRLYRWDPRVVIVNLWPDVDDTKPRPELLQQLLEGQTVLVRYVSGRTGADRDVAFRLGAGQVAAKVLGLPLRQSIVADRVPGPEEKEAVRVSFNRLFDRCDEYAEPYDAQCISALRRCNLRWERHLAEFEACRKRIWGLE